MPTIAEVREKYPQYSDMPDDKLAQALHAKFYSDMPYQDFAGNIGLETTQQPDTFLGMDKSKLSAVGQGAKDVAGGFARSGMGIVSNLMRRCTRS